MLHAEGCADGTVVMNSIRIGSSQFWYVRVSRTRARGRGSEIEAALDGLGEEHRGLGDELRLEVAGTRGVRRRAEDGVWTYTYETDPLKNLTDAAASIALIFRANVSAACCELTLDENNKGVIASLYVPKIRIVRVRALNTGQQGGYGRGDSVEVSFNIKTDRAGLPLS